MHVWDVKLFDEGLVENAATRGHTKAQGMMAERCYFGSHGVTKDLLACVVWARKAAAGGDMVGQFRLGYAYEYGEGGLAKNWPLAKEWYEKAATQGYVAAMNHLRRLAVFRRLTTPPCACCSLVRRLLLHKL